MITIKTSQEIAIMAEGAVILARVMTEVAAMAKPGVPTKELDRAAEALILKYGAVPAFKGYDGFPATICASVNDVVVHGLPSEAPMREGDILGLDIGVLHRGYYSDMAVTLSIGSVTASVREFLKTCQRALRIGIDQARPGNTIADIGQAISQFVEGKGYGIVHELSGHGIGQDLHEDPFIPNFKKHGRSEHLKEGMVVCIEPMITMGARHIKKASDGYGYATQDGSLAAHFEHTVAIEARGPKVLTQIV